MNLLSSVFTYIMVWWIVLFLVLPWGNAPAQRPALGHAASAPANARIRRKLVITTMLALVVWGAIFALIQSRYLSFRAFVQTMPE